MKATANTLIKEIADDFIQYIKIGKFFNLSAFSRKIDPNLNIDEIDKLLRIHFVLTEKDTHHETGVIDFIKELPRRIRRIKTTVSHQKNMFQGQIRGRIHWKETLSNRYNKNPEDKTLFVCTQKEKNYNIDENLVLKRLLQIIHSIVYDELKVAIEEDYEWVKGWVKKEDRLQQTLNNLFLRNVYLRRINLADVKVTERMISRAKQSRQPLYREAAYLLSRYRKLMNYEIEPEEAKDLLNNTFIQPEKTEVLFELYWTIKIIRDFKNKYNIKDMHYKIIEPGTNIIAEWTFENLTYRLYHDSTGSFKFIESIRELSRMLENKDNYIGRELKVLEELEDIVEIESDSLWGGRPDIILETFSEDGKLISVFIGEVKYTDRKNYAIQGLKELLEYIALIKEENKYFSKFHNLFYNVKNIKGGLFVDENSGLKIKENPNIKIYTFGKEDKFKEFI